MKIFISWSGNQSKELAEALRTWLPAVIQAVKPYFTPNDIEKGSRWVKDISKELDECSIGIFCLTKDNLSKPWIMFEAGAISKKIDASHVCPILFGIDAADLQGPLVQFQATLFTKGDVGKLLKNINANCGDQKLEDQVLENVYDMWWPKLETQINQILARRSSTKTGEAIRADRDLLEEILALSRLAGNRVDRNENYAEPIDPGAVEGLVRNMESLIRAIAAHEPYDCLAREAIRLRPAADYFIESVPMPRATKMDLRARLEAMREVDRKATFEDETEILTVKGLKKQNA